MRPFLVTDRQAVKLPRLGLLALCLLYVVPGLVGEGIKYYAFKIEPENVKTIPVYRMLNTQSGAHLFSSDLNEIEYIEDNLPHFAMENEGNAAFHVLEL